MAGMLKRVVIGLGAGGLLLLAAGLHQTLRVVDISHQLAHVAEARLQVATGHVYLEEILGGDDELTPPVVQAYFAAGNARLAEAAVGDNAHRDDWRTLAQAGDEVARLAAGRMAGKGAGAGSDLDQQFDARFDAFMAAAGALQQSLDAQMQRSTTLLRWQTGALLAVFVVFIALLFRLMRQTQQSAEALVASARVQEKNDELLAHRERLEAANRDQQALLALTAKCQSLETVAALSDAVTRDLCAHGDAFAAVAWLLRDTGEGRVVSSFMVEPARLPASLKGLAAQAARSRTALTCEAPPAYYRLSDPLLAGVAPSVVHILPVTCLDRVVAVFEFGFRQPPADATLRFLENALQSVAVRYYLFGQDRSA